MSHWCCHSNAPSLALAGDRFCGILHRPSASVILYTRGERGKVAKQAVYAADSPELQQLIEPDLWEQFQEDKELLEVRRH